MAPIVNQHVNFNLQRIVEVAKLTTKAGKAVEFITAPTRQSATQNVPKNMTTGLVLVSMLLVAYLLAVYTSTRCCLARSRYCFSTESLHQVQGFVKEAEHSCQFPGRRLGLPYGRGHPGPGRHPASEHTPSGRACQPENIK